MRKVAGLDPSLTGFAMGLGSWFAPDEQEAGALPSDRAIVTLHRFAAGPPDRTLAGRIERFAALAYEVAQKLRVEQPELVLLEGYAFGKSGGGGAVVSLGEFGALLRAQLLRHFTGRLVEVAPSTMKRFACGKGNAQKTAVASALAARYGLAFGSDDEADAYGLTRLGLCALGVIPGGNAHQREAAAEVQRLLRVERGEEAATTAKKRKAKRAEAVGA